MTGSICFGHCYAHHQELTTIVLITTWAVRFLGCCWLDVRCRQGWINVRAVGYSNMTISIVTQIAITGVAFVSDTNANSNSY